MCNQVYVLMATNTQDFDEVEVYLAGESSEAVDIAFDALLKENWKYVDQKFYKTFEKYKEAWRLKGNFLPVHPLPQPKPGE